MYFNDQSIFWEVFELHRIFHVFLGIAFAKCQKKRQEYHDCYSQQFVINFFSFNDVEFQFVLSVFSVNGVELVNSDDLPTWPILVDLDCLQPIVSMTSFLNCLLLIE